MKIKLAPSVFLILIKIKKNTKNYYNTACIIYKFSTLMERI